MPRLVDLTGHRIGRLTIKGRNHEKPHGPVMWDCVCDCGTELVRGAKTIRGRGIASCGCYNRELSTKRFGSHGLSQTPEYKIWLGMKARCYSPSSAAYYKYGARGIVVCERWRIFETFLADMGKRPSPRHTLDRIDGTKGYEPGNCRWATPQQQQLNLKNNVRIEFDGKSLTAGQWSRIVGLDEKTITSRYRQLGWTAEDALTLPLHFHHKRRM